MKKVVIETMKNVPSTGSVLLCAALVMLMATASVQATVRAVWDFEEAIDGQYGVEFVTQSVDSVSGLVALPASGDPVYTRGNGKLADGVTDGNSTASGILKVADPIALLSGFTAFNISFDIDLFADVTGGTQAIMRNGHNTVSWNVYMQADNALNIQMYDVDGDSFTINAYNSDISAAAGFQHVAIIWDGTNISITVDGILQELEDTTNTSWVVNLDALRASDADFGIGGLVRVDGTTGQQFNGMIDNVRIDDAATLDWKAVALWDFNGGSIGADIVSATDSISGLAAVPNINNAANPQYVSGNGSDTGAGFGGIDGVLQADDPTGTGIIGAGFTALRVTFDVDLESDLAEGGPVVFLRNGHLDENFNIYGLSNNIIGVTMKDANGTTSSGYIRTVGPALSAAAGWQTVSVVWDGESIWILVDGVAQPLTGGGTATSANVSAVLKSLLQADAPLGIGGLVRADETIGQYLSASLDNILIEGVFGTPPLVEIDDVAIEVVNGTNIVVSWVGDPSATYTVQRSLNLGLGSWSNIAENMSGVAAMMSVTNEIIAPEAFYRTTAE